LETTIVYFTHDQVEAMTMGDRIAILDHGALQQVGPPQEVYRSPANLFVARFIGSPPMNTVTGAVDLDVSPSVRAGDAVIPLPETLLPAARDATTATVVVGVRPEHVSLAPGGVLAGEVAVVESLGHERHVVCRVGDELVIARQSEDEAMPRIGDAVRLALAADHLHLFDAATGLRLGP
jgi:multiple sugar transport system ATP-binding protein